ncbi:MAG: DUF3568 family protein [Candidatus Omnitrophica bacterium]|nr:DUF3568 family protein [Candidatus Omnitrophota bacterium]
MRIFYAVLLCLMVSVSSGCVALLAGAAGGAGAAYWISNKLGQDVNGPMEQVLKATRAGLEELRLPVTKETRETGVVQVRSEYPDAGPIWVDIRSISPQKCHLEVRVGITGNKEATRRVFDTIMKRL